MQIVESTSFGVRSVAFTLEAEFGRPRFHLFPMIHVAEPQFYSEVQQRLDACDLILFEGVPSLVARIVTLSYRLAARSPRLGLVEQGKAMPIRNLGERAIRSDITTKAFDREWRRLPLALRALLLVAYPIKGIHDFAFGTREQIAKNLGTDLLPSRDDVLIDDFIEPFFDLVVNTRDRLLLAQLDDRTEGDAMTVGVVYGARHMRAVIRFLTDRQGYRITSREFLTVMSL